MNNRAAVMTSIDVIEIQERPMPVAEPGQAVVRVHSVGVCGSDVSYFRRGRVADYIVDGDIVLGHEVAGEVVEVADGVTGVAIGDRVAIEPGTPCRQCAQCLKGRYHLCPDLVFLATPPFDGALVQYMAIDARNLHRLPEGMSFDDGAMIEPLSVGLWGCHRAGLQAGDDVLVTGAGPVGLLAAEAARALGAASVTVTDVSEYRLDVARAHGFRTERSDSPGSDEFDVLLECSGAEGVLAGGLLRLAPGGRAAVIGIAKAESVALPLPSLNANEITISLVNRYQHTWPTAIALVASGRIDLSGFVTHRFGLSGTEAALSVGASDPHSLKAIIHPQEA